MATEQEEQPQIDWEQAEVHGGELHVALTAAAPHGWAARLRELLARLGQEGETRWGAIAVTRRAIKVAGVEEGGEGDLRHLLESALQQANADLAPPPEEPSDSPEQRRDERLTAAFRGFAGGERAPAS